MLALALVFFGTLFFYYCWNLRPVNFPPGPPILPIIGAVPFITLKRIHFFMEEAKEKYGPIIGTKLGMQNFVFFCSAKTVMEVFKIDEFQGRPTKVAVASNTAKKGIILTDGPFWSAQRRFTIRHLRDFGFGKSSTEGIMMEEIEEFLQDVMYERKKIQATGLFNTSTINVLWTFIAGKRHQYNDKQFILLLDTLNRTFREGGFTTGFVFLRRYFRNLLNIPEKIECDEVLIQLIQDTIDEHKNNPVPEPRDFIDVYLRAIEEENNSDFSELSLISICIDIFVAGAESIGNTISFALLYLVLYPDIQDEIWKEIDGELEGRKPVLGDKAVLPKLEAFLSEVYRINSIAPIPVPRRAMADIKYGGYVIPKNTFIVMSLWTVFRDKEHWGDPDNFRPWRFLDNEGKYVKDDWLINFGIGKRQCPGEALAKNLLFLFLVRLIQEFKFSLPPGAPTPSTLGMPGFTSVPEPFEVDLTRRTIQKGRSV